MHYTIKNAFIFSIVYISFEVGMIIANLQYTDNASFLSYASMSGALIICIGLSIFRSVRENLSNSFIIDIKNGLKSSVIYAVLVALFMYSYYTYLVPDYADIRIEQKINQAKNTPIEIIKKNHPDITKEDFISKHRDEAEFFLTPNKVIPVFLLINILLGFVYTFVFTALFRKLLFRR